MSSFCRRAVPVWIAVSIALGADTALAVIEEFENWSVGERERDDENGLDEILRSFSPGEDWRWRDRANGSRVGMGCATRDTWELNLDVKLRHAIGDRAAFTYRHRQQEELGESVTWSEYAGSWRVGEGWWAGATFRPSFEKERHDAGLFVGFRADSSRWLRLHLGFEDALNNFWDRRNIDNPDKRRRVYERRPLEWELSGLWTGAPGAVAFRGVWLPEYERLSLPPGPDSSPERELDTSGALLEIDAITARAGGPDWGLRARHKRASRTVRTPPGEDRAELRDTYVRPWLEVRLAPRWRLKPTALARWSSETHTDELGRHRLETRHLGALATAVWSARRFLDVEFGYAAERVRVRQDAHPERAFFTHDTRTEARAILSLHFHGDGVRLVLTETLESNREGHQTYLDHDKGFAHLVIEF